jgi:hypothetical protein
MNCRNCFKERTTDYYYFIQERDENYYEKTRSDATLPDGRPDGAGTGQAAESSG